MANKKPNQPKQDFSLNEPEQSFREACEVFGKEFSEAGKVVAMKTIYDTVAANNRRKARQQSRRDRADRREEKTGNRQSIGAMITKICTGLLFVTAGIFYTTEEGHFSFEHFLVSFIVGLAFLAWGILPLIIAIKRKKQDRKTVRLAEQPAVCPACGAPTKGIVCEYCGTPLNPE